MLNRASDNARSTGGVVQAGAAVVLTEVGAGWSCITTLIDLWME